MLSLEIIYQLPGDGVAPHYVFDKIFQLLTEKYKDIKFIKIHPTELPPGPSFPSSMGLAVINPKTKKRLVLTYMDNPRYILQRDASAGWYPETIQQLFCVSEITMMRNACNAYKQNTEINRLFTGINTNNEMYFDIDFDKIIKPFNYTVFKTDFDLIHSDEVFLKKKPAKEREHKLVFRGLFHGSRSQTAETINHSEILITDDRRFETAWFDELIKYRCGLSLNGAAEICHRDLEYMAVGMPMIRPLFKNTEFHNPLIPNVHYIPYDYDRNTFGIETLDSPAGYNWNLQVDALVSKWEEVKNDYDFLDYVGNNAREWYLTNAKLDVQAKSFVDMLDINLLT